MSRCVLVAAILWSGLSTSSLAGLIFDLADVTVTTTGSTQTGTMGLTVTHDGSGLTTFNSASVRVAIDPTSGLSLPTSAFSTNPQGFNSTSVASAGDAGAFNLIFGNIPSGDPNEVNVSVPNGGTLSLGEINWELDGAVTSQVFNLTITIPLNSSLTRFIPPQTNIGTAEGSGGTATFSASAVPEPSSFALAAIALASGLFVSLRRGRRSGFKGTAQPSGVSASH